MEAIELEDHNLRVFDDVVKAMAEFRAVFERGLNIRIAAELYAAEVLHLKVLGLNKPGYDALGPQNERYQIKCPATQSPHVYTNSLDFDFFILVNLDEFQLQGLWRMSREQAEQVFSEREDPSKFWATQDQIKSHAEVIVPPQEDNNLEAASKRRRQWQEISGAAPFPLTGEDAQTWVTRSRAESDEQRQRL